jgi:hypothetical protein
MRACPEGVGIEPKRSAGKKTLRNEASEPSGSRFEARGSRKNRVRVIPMESGQVGVFRQPLRVFLSEVDTFRPGA